MMLWASDERASEKTLRKPQSTVEMRGAIDHNYNRVTNIWELMVGLYMN